MKRSILLTCVPLAYMFPFSVFSAENGSNLHFSYNDYCHFNKTQLTYISDVGVP